ncbi:MAG: DMT family transporter [Alphaproteobacteria bacterium]|nr:MAG: DMT family transporter [Alphaproteobacteria bacterium]
MQRNWAILIALGLIWGAAFFATRLALADLTPLWLAAARIGLGAALLIPLAMLGPGLPPVRGPQAGRIWLHCLGMAVFTNALPFTLLAWAQLHVTSAFAGISMATVPLVIVPLAHFLVPGERMTGLKAAGFLTGFVGTVTLIGWSAFTDIAGGGIVLVAQLTCLGATCCYALGSIITRLCPPVPLISFSAAALGLASLISIPLAFSMEGIPSLPRGSALVGTLFLGLACTGLAALMLVSLIRRAGPSFLGLVNYQVPVWATLLGAFALGEEIPPRFAIALALILAGLAIAQQGLRRAAPGRVP